MRRPIIGIIGNSYVVENRYPVHAVGRINLDAAAQVAGGMPYIIAADPALVTVAELMEVCDGFDVDGRATAAARRLARAALLAS